MPAPRPLTLCEPPQLDWSRPGAPAAHDFGDIYFSVDGGLNEARTVFLKGCGLPEAWQSRTMFTICELGFGSGLNFLAAWQMWSETEPKAGRLHFVSIEKFPFDRDQLSKALSSWPELATYAEQLIAQWPGRVRGFHRLHFGNVTLTLVHDDVATALNSLEATVDAWFLDGFSPSKNPDMWSNAVLRGLAKLSAPGARLGTFTVAGSVKSALSEAGFNVEKKTGFGRKRERLEARFQGEPKDQQTLLLPPVILGAGIGGASVARAFKRRGILPHIISRGLDKAASGNSAAIIKPRLDLQDRPESRFFLSAFLYDLHAYDRAESILHRGIYHIPKDKKEAERFIKIAAQRPLPEGHTYPENNRFVYQTGLVIRPKIVLNDWLSSCEIETRAIQSLSDLPSNHLQILAPGFGIRTLLDDLNLRYSRGQLTWAQGECETPLTYGGYAVPVDGELLLGTTQDRPGDRDPFAIRPEDDAKNKAGYQVITGKTPQPSDRLSRASVRVTTADTLPMMTQLTEGPWLLSGLGSRGFVFAPLLAEALVSRLLGEPVPMDKHLWTRFGLR